MGSIEIKRKGDSWWRNDGNGQELELHEHFPQKLHSRADLYKFY